MNNVSLSTPTLLFYEPTSTIFTILLMIGIIAIICLICFTWKQTFFGAGFIGVSIAIYKLSRFIVNQSAQGDHFPIEVTLKIMLFIVVSWIAGCFIQKMIKRFKSESKR